jgi:DNA repair exonuclease SbcCD ATPase subunit
VKSVQAPFVPRSAAGDIPTAEDCYADACEQVEEQCQKDVLDLEAASGDLQADPLLLALEDLKAQKEAVDAQIRRLPAWGREFHGSRPYGLEELARHTGYSTSGVRTAYSETEVRQVATQIGWEPNRPRRDHPTGRR